MACPSRNAILRGFFFIVAVLIYLLCERPDSKIQAQAYQNNQPRQTCLITIHEQPSDTIFGQAFHRKLLIKMDDRTESSRQSHLSSTHILSRLPADRDIGGRNIPRHSQRLNSVPNGTAAPAQGSINNELENARQQPSSRMGPKQSTSKILYLLPSLFSQAHIVLVYFGLKLTYPSSVIMLTGTEAMFVTLLSLAFLAKQITSYMWVGVSLSCAGFVLSGISDYIHSPRGFEPYGIAAGDLLYAMGQITITSQMIYEEKYMRKKSIHPMHFLGAEGIYSFIFSLIMLMSVCLSDTQYSDLPNNRIEDIADAALQFANSSKVVLAVFGSLISYVVFTYLGMILIKDHGAMSRVIIESLAWCLYWMILVLMRWEQYYITQIPGLVLVPCGVLIFSHIVGCPCSRGDGALGPNLAEDFSEIVAQDGDGIGDSDNQDGDAATLNGDDDDDDAINEEPDHYHNDSHDEDGAFGGEDERLLKG